MTNYKIHPKSFEAAKDFHLPNEIIFGKLMIPFMFTCEYKDKAWGELELIPYGPLTLDPSAKVLHYSQEIFEGMKAYKVGQENPRLFRPDMNWKRFNKSAARMAMPEVPEEIFMTAVKDLASFSHKWIPRRSGESLYIRPFMIATEPNVGLKSSETFQFMVFASPVANYFAKPAVSVLIERQRVRAVEGGVGNAKTGGNYAASLLTEIERGKMGFDQTLWLDALEHKYCEELSGMNIFALINNVLVTPPLGGTILPGITRESVITMAKEKGVEVKEMPLKIDDLLSAIKDGSCSEMFACGTAVIITPIESLGERDGTRYPLKFPNGKLALELKKELLDIQEGRKEGPQGWSLEVPARDIENL